MLFVGIINILIDSFSSLISLLCYNWCKMGKFIIVPLSRYDFVIILGNLISNGMRIGVFNLKLQHNRVTSQAGNINEHRKYVK